MMDATHLGLLLLVSLARITTAVSIIKYGPCVNVTPFHYQTYSFSEPVNVKVDSDLLKLYPCVFPDQRQNYFMNSNI